MTKPVLVSAWITRLPLTAGSRPPPISGGHRYVANLGTSIGRRRHSLFPSIFEDCTDCLLGIGERFAFGIALGHDLGQGRDKHGKATAFLRLKNDGIAVGCRHDVAPVAHANRTETTPFIVSNQLGRSNQRALET